MKNQTFFKKLVKSSSLLIPALFLSRFKCQLFYKKKENLVRHLKSISILALFLSTYLSSILSAGTLIDRRTGETIRFATRVYTNDTTNEKILAIDVKGSSSDVGKFSIESVQIDKKLENFKIENSYDVPFFALVKNHYDQIETTTPTQTDEDLSKMVFFPIVPILAGVDLLVAVVQLPCMWVIDGQAKSDFNKLSAAISKENSKVKVNHARFLRLKAQVLKLKTEIPLPL